MEQILKNRFETLRSGELWPSRRRRNQGYYLDWPGAGHVPCIHNGPHPSLLTRLGRCAFLPGKGSGYTRYTATVPSVSRSGTQPYCAATGFSDMLIVY
jgi:hypothetical protein